MTKRTPSFAASLALLLLGIGAAPLANAPYVFTAHSTLNAVNGQISDASNAGHISGHDAFADIHDRRTFQQEFIAAGSGTIDRSNDEISDIDNMRATGHDYVNTTTDIRNHASSQNGAIPVGNGGEIYDVNNDGQIKGYLAFTDIHNHPAFRNEPTVTGHNSYPGGGSISPGSEPDNTHDNNDDERVEERAYDHRPNRTTVPNISFPQMDAAFVPVTDPASPETYGFPQTEGETPDSVSGTTAAVPEPGTCVLMLAGLSLLGLATQRRKQKNTLV